MSHETKDAEQREKMSIKKGRQKSDHNTKKRRRFVYSVKPGESLYGILRTIQSVRATDIVLDVSRHTSLRCDGSLRRTIVAAAEQRGKVVTFSMSSFVEDTPLSDDTSVLPEKSGKRKHIAIAVQSRFGGRDQVDDSSKERPVHLIGTGRTVAIGFLVAAVILVVIAAAIFAPKASVHIVPVTQPVSADVILEATVDADNVGRNMVSAHMFSETVEVEGVFSVLNPEQQGERANGSVKIMNRTISEQQIKSGSRLVHEDGTVVIMKGPAFIPPQGAVTVFAEAEEGGQDGNITSGRLDFVALDEHSRTVLHGEVNEQFSGGTDVFVYVVSEHDIQNAGEELVREKRGEIEDTFASRIPENALVLPELRDISVKHATSEPEVGTETDSFRLSATLLFRMFIVPEDTIREAIVSTVFADTKEAMEFMYPIDMTIWEAQDVRWDRQTAVLRARVENTAYPKIDTEELSAQLAERTVDGAEKFLLGIPGVTDVEVQLSPFWVKRIPRFRRNITIVIDLP